MKKLFLIFNLSILCCGFSQSKIKFDCLFVYETENGCNYANVIEGDNHTRLDYYNCENKLIQSAHFLSNGDYTESNLDGLQVLYHYDGSIYSQGIFKRGKKDGIWKINQYTGLKEYQTYELGKLLKLVTINQEGDTSSIDFYTTRKIKTHSYKNGKLNEIHWLNYKGRDSILEIIENNTSCFINYRDSSNMYVDNIMPKFIGGTEVRNNFISNNLTYPPEASDNEICGIVTIQFLVNVNGDIEDVITTGQTSHPLLEKEATRIMKMQDGLWEPGSYAGKKINVWCKIDVVFSLGEE